MQFLGTDTDDGFRWKIEANNRQIRKPFIEFSVECLSLEKRQTLMSTHKSNRFYSIQFDLIWFGLVRCDS